MSVGVVSRAGEGGGESGRGESWLMNAELQLERSNKFWGSTAQRGDYRKQNDTVDFFLTN